jgi:prevent-host-death family protein
MTIQANVHEAKTRFSELLDRVQRGEEVIIAKAGKPCARLVPIYPEGTRVAGAFRGRISGDPLGSVGPDDGSWG